MRQTEINPTSALQPSKRTLRARYRRALIFFTRTALGVFFWDVLLRGVGLRSLSRRTAPRRYRNTARRYRALAVRLGGVWIKVGQFLSARADVLPEYVTSELEHLQDEVPGEATEHMLAVVEAEFGEPATEIYARFDPEPLASASLGQAHRAELPTGEAVVVKVQRPGIEEIIRVDLRALQVAVNWLKRFKAISRRADLDALLDEFSSTLWAELDYLAEADNARAFGEMFAQDPAVCIPAVYEKFTTRRVLTLEDVYFIKINDHAAIEAAGINRSDVAERLFQTYLRQIFIEGFFHADPHPGNLFVQPLEDGDWRLVFVDFGMVGRLSPRAKEGLRDLAVAIGTRDLDRMIQAYQTLEVLLPGADLDRIKQAEAAVFDRFWGRNMRELRETHPREMRQFLRQFRDVLYEMPFQVPSDLIFLGRCVGILSGMCTSLNPEFNVFEGLTPFARQLLAEEGGDWMEALLQWMEREGRALASLPSRLDSMLVKIERGEMTVTAKAAPELDRSLERLSRAINRLVAAIVFAVLLVVGALLYINGEPILGAIGLAIALLAAFWVLLR
ncbi:MAG: AarF/ABC1/UbiB kinase family protein [Anaerolineae bacterium]|nr:MAG: AarF/ABC1/UbiB kinase family protein [Anaerolineae bacterium]